MTRQPSAALAALAILAVMQTDSPADERLKGIACRSVHLGYHAPEADLFYNEVTVTDSAEGSYFMACGFNMGYFGIQELGGGRKVVLFSVWDPGDQNNPNAVPDEQRVQVRYHAPDVRVKRFGGEGTGAQSFFDLDWATNRTYRFCVQATPDADRTAFTAHLYLPELREWKHLATFATLARNLRLSGLNSFVEDFRRNRVSTTHLRRARFGNGWVRDPQGAWHALTAARFTADSNPVMNIDAGADAGRFFLATGGATTNAHTPLWKTIRLPAAGARPPDLPPQAAEAAPASPTP